MPLSGKDQGARILGSASSVTSDVPRLLSWTQPTPPRQRAGRCRGRAPRSSWSARNLTQSHRKGRCRNRASPLRSQTCSSNLVPASERIPRATSRRPFRCARSAEGAKRDNASKAVGSATASEGLLGAVITTLCIWTWSGRRTNKIRIRAAELGRQPRQKIH